MITKFSVGQSAYLPCSRTQSVKRLRVSVILISCSKPNAGGNHLALWPADCEVSYRLDDGSIVAEEVLHSNPARAFEAIDAMTNGGIAGNF